MPEPKGTANVGLVQKRAGYDLCQSGVTDNLFVTLLDEAGNILTDERGQYLIEE